MEKKTRKGFDASLEKMAELIIRRIEAVELDWKKPWVEPSRNGNPRNITGREYSGWNRLMLILLGMEKAYEIPVYMTFSQAREYGASVKKGQVGFPVCYYSQDCLRKDTGERIAREDYLSLDEKERQEYYCRGFWKTYTVFNVDQTDLNVSCPGVYERLILPPEDKDVLKSADFRSNELLDTLMEQNGWICPIRFANGKGSCFSTREKAITMPLRKSFNCACEFYSTLLHEMAHSTGMPEFLSRDMNAAFGSPCYAREELIAELTSAMEALSLGITSTIQDNNVAYLQNWIRALRWQPDFLKLILPEVERCVSFIDRKVRDFYKVAHEGIDKGMSHLRAGEFFGSLFPELQM